MKNIIKVFSLLLSSAVLIILTVVFLSCGAPPFENTKKIPGNIKKFDPVASIPAIAAFAGKDSQLIQMAAGYVKPDGTMEIGAEYDPKAFYWFIRKAAPPKAEKEKAPLPLGVSSSASTEEKEYWELIKIYINKPYRTRIVIPGIVGYHLREHGGMEKKVEPFSYAPGTYDILYDKCSNADPPVSLRTVWEWAEGLGAPSENSVATINFWRIDYNEKQGYKFNLSGTAHNYQFDIEGKRIK